MRATEALHTNGIPLPQGDVRQQDHRVEGMIKMTEIVILSAHPPAAIEQEQYGLVAFVLIILSDGFTGAGSRFPINLAQTVADPVFTQLQKGVALATPAARVNAKQCFTLI